MPDQTQPEDRSTEARLINNTEAISETQGFMLAALEKMQLGNDTPFDKLYKIGQLVFPLIIVWLVYYVNAELTPLKMDIVNNRTVISVSKKDITELRGKLHRYDVREARRDVVMEQLKNDIQEIKNILKEMKR